jgi:hypothetical protein
LRYDRRKPLIAMYIFGAIESEGVTERIASDVRREARQR